MTLDDYIKDYVRQVVKEELENIKSRDLPGKQWVLDDLCQYIGRSKNWVKDEILLPNKETLDVECGGFVRYPKGKGSSYRMSEVKMKQWLDENTEKAL